MAHVDIAFGPRRAGDGFLVSSVVLRFPGDGYLFRAEMVRVWFLWVDKDGLAVDDLDEEVASVCCSFRGSPVQELRIDPPIVCNVMIVRLSRSDTRYHNRRGNHINMQSIFPVGNSFVVDRNPIVVKSKHANQIQKVKTCLECSFEFDEKTPNESLKRWTRSKK